MASYFFPLTLSSVLVISLLLFILQHAQAGGEDIRYATLNGRCVKATSPDFPIQAGTQCFIKINIGCLAAPYKYRLFFSPRRSARLTPIGNSVIAYECSDPRGVGEDGQSNYARIVFRPQRSGRIKFVRYHNLGDDTSPMIISNVPPLGRSSAQIYVR